MSTSKVHPRRIRQYLNLVDPDGVEVAFTPDDDVPAWAAEIIEERHPAAWAVDGEPFSTSTIGTGEFIDLPRSEDIR